LYEKGRRRIFQRRGKTCFFGCPKHQQNASLLWSACGENAMEVQTDYKERLALFNAHEVQYMIIGAYALAFHGAPRYTGDLDILVRPDRENGGRILNALAAFGFGSLGLSIDDFAVPDRVVQLGVPPVRVDIVTSITGVSWDDARENSVPGKFGSIPASYIGKEAFIRNKRALGRNKDLADAEALSEI
jgi:hypothetical protein